MADLLIWVVAALGAVGGVILGQVWGAWKENERANGRPNAMPWKTRASASRAGATRFATAAALAILLSGCAATMGAGDAGCASFAEARLARPPAETVAAVPPHWADWIADLDDRMTGTCR
ncbi:MAG: hypothetical protein JKP98_26085 [Rhodobacteraceae bacterium]|nr:hypothetical protein [Paracoccaceae bacterium]